MFQSEQKAAVAFTWASKIEMEQQRYRECLSVTRAYNYCQVQPLSKVFSKTSTTEEEHCALFAREGRKWLILVPRGHVLFQIVEEMIREWVFASLFVIIDLKQSGRQRRGRRRFFKYEFIFLVRIFQMARCVYRLLRRCTSSSTKVCKQR